MAWAGGKALTDEPASRITPYRPSSKIDQIRADRTVRLQHLHFAILARHMRLVVGSWGVLVMKRMRRSIEETLFYKENGMMER